MIIGTIISSRFGYHSNTSFRKGQSRNRSELSLMRLFSISFVLYSYLEPAQEPNYLRFYKVSYSTSSAQAVTQVIVPYFPLIITAFFTSCTAPSYSSENTNAPLTRRFANLASLSAYQFGKIFVIPAVKARDLAPLYSRTISIILR